MNEYLQSIIPLTIVIVIFFLISIYLFKYLGINFKTNDEEHILKRVINVETYDNLNKKNNNIKTCSSIG